MNLTCEARGYPQPQIMWRREDGRSITANGHTKKGITKKHHKKYHKKITNKYHKKGITKNHNKVLPPTFTPRKVLTNSGSFLRINYGRSLTLLQPTATHTKKGSDSSYFLLAFAPTWPMYSAA